MKVLCFIAIFVTVAGDRQTCQNEYVEAKLFRAICAGLKNPSNTLGQEVYGTTYTRWGRSRCSGDTELVYSGFVGGSSYTDSGSQVNMLCLPMTPEYGGYNIKVSDHPWIGGAIYSMHKVNIKNTVFDASKYTLHGIPCSLCWTKRKTSVIMIPGLTKCVGKWTKEYTGYLFGGNPGFKSGSEYLCVDENAESLSKKAKHWSNKPIINPVYSKCNEALPCPPYVDGKLMTCVVCSK